MANWDQIRLQRDRVGESPVLLCSGRGTGERWGRGTRQAPSCCPLCLWLLDRLGLIGPVTAPTPQRPQRAHAFAMVTRCWCDIDQIGELSGRLRKHQASEVWLHHTTGKRGGHSQFPDTIGGWGWRGWRWGVRSRFVLWHKNSLSSLTDSVSHGWDGGEHSKTSQYFTWALLTIRGAWASF